MFHGFRSWERFPSPLSGPEDVKFLKSPSRTAADTSPGPMVMGGFCAYQTKNEKRLQCENLDGMHA